MIVHVCPPDGRTFRSFRTASDAAEFASKHVRKVIGVRKDIEREHVVCVRRKRDGTRVPVKVRVPCTNTGRYIVTLRSDIARPKPKSRLVRVIMTNGIRLSDA